MLVPVSGVELGEDHEGWAVVVLTGEADLYLAPALRECVDALVAEDRARIVVDLEHVEFMDSSALGVIVYGLRRTRTLGGALRLAGPGTQVRRLLELTRLGEAVEVFADAASACREPER
ncbi:STAS domain-containing protein [Kitasatospora indigofera]|uniref:STAS domain-containing protein n=1 Tax=Kitasatospora indigofera TaxID=67307 RepID=UPI0036A5E20A